MLSYLFGSSKSVKVDNSTSPVSTLNASTNPVDITVSCAESVTAGALANSLASEPGASKYFKGGIVAYNASSKKELLGIDTVYAELHNHANPFTTAEMAKAIVGKFKTRIGIATTGYSLPFHRNENKEADECELHIDKPYAYICLYDALLDKNITIKEEFDYDPTQPRSLQRAMVQAKVSIRATQLYRDYIKGLTPLSNI